MKAISPLISIVLVIAFTLAVATIIGTWLTYVARTETETVEAGLITQINCTKAILEIVDVTCTGNDVTIAMANIGQIDLTNPNFYVKLTNGTSTTYSTTDTISPGAHLVNTTTVGFSGGTLDFVRVTALCAGTTGISAEKSSIGDSC